MGTYKKPDWQITFDKTDHDMPFRGAHVSVYFYQQWSEQLSTLEQVEHALPRARGKNGFAVLQSKKPGVTGY